MKIPRHAMMPTLDAAIEAFVGDGLWYRPPVTTGRYREPDRARDLLALYADLKSGIGVGAGVCILLWIVIGVFIAAGESILLLALPVLAMLGTRLYVLWIEARRPDGPTPTADFLGAALPRLGLPPISHRYAEALVAVYSGKIPSPEVEGLRLLRRLADEEARLAAISSTIEGVRGEKIAKEVARLRMRVQGARDPGAREVLARSLALAERRHDSAARADAMRERIEAHGELLDQTSRIATEGLLSRGDLGPELDDLRRNVAALGDEAVALEAAVQEMRAL